MSAMIGAKAKFPSSQRLYEQKHFSSPPRNKVCNSVFEAIGNTPLIKLKTITKERKINASVYVKCEYLNPGGSIKDRIGYSMMQSAKTVVLSDIKKRVLEPTSGNTGTAIAMNASLNGYKSLILTKHKCSDEKVNVMKLVGAEIAFLKDSDNELETCQKYMETGNFIMLDQFENELNPRTHYDTTAKEILEALHKVDVAVMGAGTGGTLTGVGTKLKEVNPNCIVVAADIEGSSLFHAEKQPHPFLVEGIMGGSDPPITLDMSVPDICEVTSDGDAFRMARELARKEGILCGGSSGLAVACALKYLQTSGKDSSDLNVVVILPDGIRNYMTKFVSDHWMEAKFFIEPPQLPYEWYKYKIQDTSPEYDTFLRDLPEGLRDPIIVTKKQTCMDVLHAMKEKSRDVALVVENPESFSNKLTYKKLLGVISKESILYHLTHTPKNIYGHWEPLDLKEVNITDLMEKNLYTLPLNCQDVKPTVGLLSRILDITRYVVLGHSKDSCNGPDQKCKDAYFKGFEPLYIVTSDAVIDFIIKESPDKLHGNRFIPLQQLPPINA